MNVAPPLLRIYLEIKYNTNFPTGMAPTAYVLPMYLALIIRLFCYKVDITVDPKMSVITRFQSTIFLIKFSGATAVYQESVGEVVSLETNQA